MSRVNVSESFCNIARSLSIVGDRWTLLIMREISLRNRRFEEIQAQTGMSSHLLAARLRRMEEDKIVERRVYNARPLRHEYFPTPKGKDLDGVMLALRNWDLRWGGSDGKGAAAVNLTDKRTGKVIDGTWHNPDGETFDFANTNGMMSELWKAERDANVAAFYEARQHSGKSRKKATGRKPQQRAKKRTVKPTVRDQRTDAKPGKSNRRTTKRVGGLT